MQQQPKRGFQSNYKDLKIYVPWRRVFWFSPSCTIFTKLEVILNIWVKSFLAKEFFQVIFIIINQISYNLGPKFFLCVGMLNQSYFVNNSARIDCSLYFGKCVVFVIMGHFGPSIECWYKSTHFEGTLQVPEWRV